MPRKRKGTRVQGPYVQPNGTFRLTLHREDGERRDFIYQSKATALAAKERIAREIEFSSGLTVRDALEAYRPHLAKDNSEKSIESSIYKINCIFRDRLDETITSFKKEDGKKLYKSLCERISPQTKKPYAPASHRQMLIEARTFMNWCVEEKRATVNIFADTRGEGSRNRGADKPTPTFDETVKFVDVAERLIFEGNEGAMAALLALYLDIRCKEIVSRRVRDVDAGGTILKITRATTKTDAGKRDLEIPEVLRPIFKVLSRGKEPTDFLFGDGKTPRTRDYPSVWCLKICRMARIPAVRAHAMRRAHATIATEKGVTGHVLATAMGHRSFKTTMHSYVKRGTAERVQREQAFRMIQGERKGPHAAKDQDDDEETLPVAAIAPQ